MLIWQSVCPFLCLLIGWPLNSSVVLAAHCHGDDDDDDDDHAHGDVPTPWLSAPNDDDDDDDHDDDDVLTNAELTRTLSGRR